jgi:hypothetical protein
MYTVFENRRAGQDRRKEDRRVPPPDPARIPGGQDRRSGTDRRRFARRASDREDVIPERFDYLWRNRWP